MTGVFPRFSSYTTTHGGFSFTRWMLSRSLSLSRFSPMVCFWVAGVSTDGGSRGAAEFGRQARGVRVSRKLATFSALGAHNWPDVTVGPSWQCQRPSPSFPAPDSIGHFENFGKHFRENGLIFASNILHNDCTRKLTLPRTDCPIVDDGPSGMMINIKSQNKKALPLTH